MARSTAYIAGVLDTLVKAGAVSPAYAAGVSSVLVKDAQYASAWWNPFDTEAENLQQQWNGFMNRNPGAVDPRTGMVSVGAGQAKEMIDKARPWYDSMGGRAMANMRHWGRMASRILPEFITGKQMSAEESRRLLEYDRNKFRRDFLNRGGAAVPATLHAAFQDEATRDAKYARRDQRYFMSPEKLNAEFGVNDEAAAKKFRSPWGTAAVRGGMYDSAHDVQAPRTRTMHNSPLAGMYGSKDRNRLFTQSYRNGLGMY